MSVIGKIKVNLRSDDIKTSGKLNHTVECITVNKHMLKRASPKTYENQQINDKHDTDKNIIQSESINNLILESNNEQKFINNHIYLSKDNSDIISINRFINNIHTHDNTRCDIFINEKIS